jgi:hypothetical protein
MPVSPQRGDRHRLVACMGVAGCSPGCCLAWCNLAAARARLRGRDGTCDRRRARYAAWATVSTGGAGLGLSWLGSGVRVAHTGRALKATFGVAMVGFKFRFAQSNQGAMHYERNSLITATGVSESVVIGSSVGPIDMVRNMPPQ